MLALALTLLAAVPAGAQYYGKNKVQTRNLQWRVLVTPHFDLHFHDGAEELAVRASIIAERAYKEYADRLDRDLPFRVPFILYSSHNEFAQTNIAEWLIGEGTGGFSEPFRNRMVLPYNGSHADFVHVIRHELVHVFMFDMAFGARSTDLGRNTFFQIPLWFAEGVAEWLSSGWDAEADMFIRDATINDYLYPLDLVGGFLVYKEGQAAMRLLSERYGPEKLNEFWANVGRLRSVERALRATYGLTTETLNELFARSMRRRYWPDFNDLEQISEITRPLTDHEAERASFNGRPALSPDGDRLVYFSDREGVIDLYLMSAIDGRIIRRLGRSMRSSHFESFHSFRSGLSWSPDGREIALVAKSGNHETLHTVDVETGEQTRALQLGLDVAANPAWSPDGRAIALVGTRLGRTDLYVVELPGPAPAPGSTLDLVARLAFEPPVDLEDGVRLWRLSDDVGDEGVPAWSPDGRHLAFAFNPEAELAFELEVDLDGHKKLLWARPAGEAATDSTRTAPGPAVEILDLQDGSRHRIYQEQDHRRQPVWLDGRTLAVIDATGGISNLAICHLDSAATGVVSDRRLTNVLGGIENLTYSARSDRLVCAAFHNAGYDLYAVDHFHADWRQRVPGGQRPEPIPQEPPVLVTRAGPPDTLLVDPDRVGRIERYDPTFRVDASRALAGGAVYWTSAGGLGFANLLTLTDDLGDRRIDILLNFYGAIDNSDLGLTYTYRKRRVDWSVGAFLYNNFYNSVFTSVGELLTEQDFFKEKNYGIFGRASYPLSTFERFDLDLQLYNSDRTSYEFDEFGFLVPEAKTRNRLIQPSLGFTHDNALYGLHGPVTGSRWSVNIARGLPLSESSLDRWTGLLDARKYWLPFRRNSIALHVTYAHSAGDDPRAFVLGGPWTLRGYDFYDYQTVPHLAGTKMFLASVEYRLPFLDYLIFGWPGQWGFTGIGGVLFCDVGSAWYDRVRFFGDDRHGDWGFRDLRGNLGLGLRANFLGLPMKFDWAWRTDLRTVHGSQFHFSIAPDF